MVDVAAIGDRIETQDDLGAGDAATFAYWETQERIAEKEERPWIKRAREIVKRYRDERPQGGPRISRFNILWSNVQTLAPTLYARTPRPDVERRFHDEDPTGRLAAILIERCLAYAVDAFDFDGIMRAVVQDRLLPGRGVARVVYVPHFRNQESGVRSQEEAEPHGIGEKGLLPDNFRNQESGVRKQDEAEPHTIGEKGLRPDGLTPDDLIPDPEVVFEEVKAVYVFWEDYREGPARQWSEVPWVRFRAYLTRDELIARFGADKGRKVNLDHTPRGGNDPFKDDPPPDAFKKAIIHEVWDKTARRVIWYAPGTPDLILDQQDDPLRLPGFFPNPDPLLATTTTDKRIPVPDFVEYQDQAHELDLLTARIDRLTRALKVSGIYPGEEKALLQQLIDEGTENRLIPVADWPAFVDKGSLANMIQWMPVQQIAETLLQLYNARDKVKAALYEVTGIGDIMRGMTSPQETLGAQELKANFATRRIVPQQKEVARFSRDLLRLMGAVIAEHFSERTIAMIAGYGQLADDGGQMTEDRSLTASPSSVLLSSVVSPLSSALCLIRQDGAESFRIEIEADSTIAPDEQAEKQARVEFLQQMVPLLEQFVPLAMGNPALASVCREITLFAVRGFRVARTLEESLEQAFDALARMPPTAPDGASGGRPPSAADVAVRAHAIDAKTQIDRDKNAIAAAKAFGDQQLEQAKLASQSLAEHARLGMEAERLETEKASLGLRAGEVASRNANALV
jgi:hypothetical protein